MKPITIPANLTALAHRHIKNHILEGGLDDGERLTEESIASQLGISKSPIREALHRLEVEGLIRIEPRRGAYLRTFTTKDIADLYDYREALETHAVLTTKITPALIADLNESVASLQERHRIGQKTGYIRQDIDFHSRIASGTDNQRLVDALENLRDQLQIFRMKTYDLSKGHGVYAHARLVELLLARDRTGAVNLMREHIRTARDELIAHVSQSSRTVAKKK